MCAFLYSPINGFGPETPTPSGQERLQVGVEPIAVGNSLPLNEKKRGSKDPLKDKGR
jgi:hypothetical protein